MFVRVSNHRELNYLLKILVEYIMEKTKLEKLKKLLNKEKGVRIAYLFGSFATAKETKLSDVDIGILFERSLSKREKFNLQLKLINEIAGILKKEEIDLVDMDNASILLKYNIIKEGYVLKDNKERAKIEAKILSDYLDMKYYFDRHTKLAIERISAKGLL